MKIVWGYASSPGGAATPPVQWPAVCQIQPATEQATLVMFVHPQCPCSRASIGELASLMTTCRGKLMATVAFYKPAGFTDDWTKTDLWRSASEIPGVSVVGDDDGNLAS